MKNKNYSSLQAIRVHRSPATLMVVFLLAAFSAIATSSSRAATISGNGLSVSIQDGGALIKSLTFSSSEFFELGFDNSDWGIQVGTDTTTFRKNSSETLSFPIAMSLSSSTSTSANYSGLYNVGGTNITLIRSYEILPTQSIVRVTLTLTNASATPTVLRAFETFDPDGGGPSSTQNDRFVLASAGGAMVVGQAVRGDSSAFALGALDAGVIVGASLYDYSGISTGALLNNFFTVSGADSNGGSADGSIDVGRSVSLAAGASTVLTTYLAFGNSSANVQAALALIPEPTTALLVGLGSVVLLLRRRRGPSSF